MSKRVFKALVATPGALGLPNKNWTSNMHKVWSAVLRTCHVDAEEEFPMLICSELNKDWYPTCYQTHTIGTKKNKRNQRDKKTSVLQSIDPRRFMACLIKRKTNKRKTNKPFDGQCSKMPWETMGRIGLVARVPRWRLGILVFLCSSACEDTWSRGHMDPRWQVGCRFWERRMLCTCAHPKNSDRVGSLAGHPKLPHSWRRQEAWRSGNCRFQTCWIRLGSFCRHRLHRARAIHLWMDGMPRWRLVGKSSFCSNPKKTDFCKFQSWRLYIHNKQQTKKNYLDTELTRKKNPTRNLSLSKDRIANIPWLEAVHK